MDKLSTATELVENIKGGNSTVALVNISRHLRNIGEVKASERLLSLTEAHGRRTKSTMINAVKNCL